MQNVGGLVTGVFGSMLTRADDLRESTNPRAIFVDSVEPDWDERLTTTVNPETADLVGASDRVIQAPVDHVPRQGGGTVQVLPGTYRLRDSIFLQSKVRLIRSGADSVLFKEPSVTTKLIVDRDHWGREATLADPKGFQVATASALPERTPCGKSTKTLQVACANKQRINNEEDPVFVTPGRILMEGGDAILGLARVVVGCWCRRGEAA